MPRIDSILNSDVSALVRVQRRPRGETDTANDEDYASSIRDGLGDEWLTLACAALDRR